MTMNPAFDAVKAQFDSLLASIHDLSQKLDPVAFGKTKAINALIESTPVEAGVTNVVEHLKTKDAPYVTAFVTLLRRELKAYDEVVSRWVADNVDTSENAKLSDEDEVAIRTELDQKIEAAKITRSFLLVSGCAEEDLATVPNKRKGAKRSTGKRLKGKFTWTVRTMDAAGNILEEDVVAGHNLTAVGVHTKVGSVAVKEALRAAGYTDEDFANPPTKMVFDLTGKKGEILKVVGVKQDSAADDDNDADDDEPEADDFE